MAFIRFILVCIALYPAYLSATPKIATQISLRGNDFAAIAGKLIHSGTINARYAQIKQLEIFLIENTTTDTLGQEIPIGTMTPVALIKAPAELAGELNNTFLGLVSFKATGEWITAGPVKNDPEWEQTVKLVQKSAMEPVPTDSYIKIYDARATGKYLHENSMLNGILGHKLPKGLVPDELESLESLEIRAIHDEGKIRVIILAKAKPDTMLHTFLCQRIPAAPPQEHAHIGIASASAYGYCLFNPQITSDYLEYLAGQLRLRKGALADTVSEAATSIRRSWGYAAAVEHPAESGCRVFLRGNWSKDEAANMLISWSSLAEQSDEPSKSKSARLIKDAFWIDQIPVYKTDPSPVFFAIKNNYLAAAKTAEGITDFVQEIESESPGMTLGKAFIPYPTLCTQFKIDIDALVSAGNLGAWSPARKSGYAYGACQLLKGQAAVTIDMPSAFFDNLALFIKEQSKKTSAAQKL